MKFTFKHDFGWSFENITEILSAGKELVVNEDHPNVSSYKELEFKQTGTGFTKKAQWDVRGDVPKAVRKVISGDRFTFTEETLWDEKSSTFTINIIPGFLKKRVRCSLKSKWTRVSEGKTTRVIDGFISVKIPLIGRAAEKTALPYLKEIAEANALLIKKGFTRILGPEAGPD